MESTGLSARQQRRARAIASDSSEHQSPSTAEDASGDQTLHAAVEEIEPGRHCDVRDQHSLLSAQPEQKQPRAQQPTTQQRQKPEQQSEQQQRQKQLQERQELEASIVKLEKRIQSPGFQKAPEGVQQSAIAELDALHAKMAALKKVEVHHTPASRSAACSRTVTPLS